jgi:predicted metal-dependent hydrolase
MKKRTVTIAAEEVEIDIVRSSRRTIALYVRPGGTLQIRAPWYVPVYALMQFVHQKTGWIAKQREKLKEVRPVADKKQISDGSLIPFLGRNITVVLRPAERTGFGLRGDELIIGFSDRIFPDKVAAIVDAWYADEAKRYFPVRTRELAGIHYGKLPEPRSVGVRRMKRRWGSCSTNGNISLNSELMKKDPVLVDYVIIHELCHLVHHNHGKEYYALLESIVPDYRVSRKRLLQS